MNAQVIAFPRLLEAPVIQHPRRGRLPNGVGSLRAVRMKRMRKAKAEEAQCASDTRSVAWALRTLESEAYAQGWVGFVVAALDGKGNPCGKVGVRCTEDRESARRITDWLRLRL